LSIISCNREEELMEHFSTFGKISEVHLVLDKETKRSRGIAYILYLIPECAARYYLCQKVVLLLLVTP
jgi:hypothetical protein